MDYETHTSLVEINTVVNNSTGRIMHDIQREADILGMETLSVVGRRHVYKDVPCVKYGNALSFWTHVIWTTLTDRHGLEPFVSVIYTKKMVRKIRETNPDIIHLHNIHGYYLHYPTLMRYLANEYKGSIVWTFHDLWPITGHCPHYVAIDCKKWMTGCSHCPNKKRYPVSLGAYSAKPAQPFQWNGALFRFNLNVVQIDLNYLLLIRLSPPGKCSLYALAVILLRQASA